MNKVDEITRLQYSDNRRYQPKYRIKKKYF